jgi:hypothetical protein
MRLLDRYLCQFATGRRLVFNLLALRSATFAIYLRVRPLFAGFAYVGVDGLHLVPLCLTLFLNKN